MLGQYIRVVVDPVFDEGKASSASVGTVRVTVGTARDLPGHEKVYLFSSIPVKGLMRLKITGIITEKNGKKSYIASPDGLIMFEPDIRDMLKSYLDPDSYELCCRNEKSCGAIIFRKKSGNTEFLLVKNKRGGNWGFPKGHVELGEDEYDTAKREVLEETGLSITPMEGFRAVSEYYPRGKIFKQVVFFLAEMPGDGEVTLQQCEIDRCMWADYSLAMKTFRFNNDRSVLTMARNFLREKQ